DPLPPHAAATSNPTARTTPMTRNLIPLPLTTSDHEIRATSNLTKHHYARDIKGCQLPRNHETQLPHPLTRINANRISVTGCDYSRPPDKISPLARRRISTCRRRQRPLLPVEPLLPSRSAPAYLIGSNSVPISPGRSRPCSLPELSG